VLQHHSRAVAAEAQRTLHRRFRCTVAAASQIALPWPPSRHCARAAAAKSTQARHHRSHSCWTGRARGGPTAAAVAARSTHPDGAPHISNSIGSSSSSSSSGADAHFMRIALDLAAQASAKGEIPVGAVVVDSNGQIVAVAHNTTEASLNPLGHAELLAIQSAAAAGGGWRLAGCTLYVTLEPCPMCAGAILNARLARVVYGAGSPRIGADGGWIRMLPPYSAAVVDAIGGAEGTEEVVEGPAAARGSKGWHREGGGGSSSSDGGAGGDGDGQQQQEQQQQQQQQQQHEGSNSNSSSSKGLIEPVGPHPFHPNLEVTRGVLQQECADLLRSFFRRRRQGAADAKAAACAEALGGDSLGS